MSALDDIRAAIKAERSRDRKSIFGQPRLVCRVGEPCERALVSNMVAENMDARLGALPPIEGVPVERATGFPGFELVWR